ncbi:MAG: thioredoxin-disulfide reductase [Candidatus Bathyarchaeota archaeon B23]|nr:MAG: thioredoxin-disulfide reductase [Candidatus Bathyarchaeota archaeon B23]
MKAERWELIVLGAGPAGLAAGLYAARGGLETVLLEANVPGGLTLEAPRIENYPGFPGGILGRELAARMVEQCVEAGAEIRYPEEALKMEVGEIHRVETDGGSYEGEVLIIATGTRHRELGAPGERRLLGRGVSYCALCDGPLFRGRPVAVVGGGNTAAAEALYLSEIASEVTLIHRRPSLRAEGALVEALEGRGVRLLLNAVVEEIEGEEYVEGLRLRVERRPLELEVEAVFISVGREPNSRLAGEAGVEVDDGGYIVVDERQRTNLQGVYAAGDVTNRPYKQIGTAVGQGITAALEAYGYVRRPYYWE